MIIVSIDSAVLNLALPSISRDLGAMAGQLQRIVNAYTLVFASLLLTTGAMGDRLARKLLLIIGLALFAAGSLEAALAASTTMLILWRAAFPGIF